MGKRQMGLPHARITARLGDPSGPRAVSLIAIHQHGIPDAFPDAVPALAAAHALRKGQHRVERRLHFGVERRVAAGRRAQRDRRQRKRADLGT